MSNAYIYVFTPKTFSQQEVADFLDKTEGIDTWFYSMPNSMFIVGTVPARTLSRLLKERFGEHRHFITIISKKANAGWMPKDHWSLLPSEDA